MGIQKLCAMFGLLLTMYLSVQAQMRYNPEELKGPVCVVYDTLNKKVFTISPQQSQYNVIISDGIAHLRLTQKFVNNYSSISSFAYVFPLPHDGSVHAMSMEYRGKIYRAKIMERIKALQIYDSIKALGLSAALLLQERPNIFQQSIANIAKGDSAFVRIELSIPLKYNDGEYELALPTMIGERYQSQGEGTVPSSGQLWNPPENRDGQSLQINTVVQSGFKVSEITSPTHSIIVADLPVMRQTLEQRDVITNNTSLDMDNIKAVILKDLQTYPNRDYVLKIKRAKKLNDFTFASHYNALYGKGHFALNIFPDDSLFNGKRGNIEVVLLVDISGSQSGWPLLKEKEIAKNILSRLLPNDRFTVLSFSDDVKWSFGEKTLVNASSSNIQKGTHFIDSLVTQGGTQLLNGVNSALSVPVSSENLRFYIFLTDGFITNESAILDAIQNHVSKPTIFTFGAGNNLNRYFLERCAQIGNGFATEVTERESISPLVDKAWEKISQPQISNVSVRFDGISVQNVINPKGTVLYAGSPLTVYGTYTGSGMHNVKIEGFKEGQKIVLEKSVNFASGYNGNFSIPLIWARQKIEQLSLSQGITDNKKDSIILLSTEYQVLSKYTAFLAVNPENITEENSLREKLNSSFSTEIVKAVKNFELAFNIAVTGGKLIITAPMNVYIDEICIYNMSGKIVQRIKFNKRTNKLVWDGLLKGNLLRTGKYFCKIKLSNGQIMSNVIFWQ